MIQLEMNDLLDEMFEDEGVYMDVEEYSLMDTLPTMILKLTDIGYSLISEFQCVAELTEPHDIVDNNSEYHFAIMDTPYDNIFAAIYETTELEYYLEFHSKTKFSEIWGFFESLQMDDF